MSQFIRSSALPKFVLAAGLMLAGAGCTSYYRVTDPTTGRIYYTTDMQQQGNGAVRLHDAATGNEVTVQNSEVAKVNKETFESHRGQSGEKASTQP